MTNRMVSTPARGFTLLEVMVVVAIVAVLAAIAMPAYSRYQIRGMQSVGREALMELKMRLEQYRNENDTYPSGGYNVSELGIRNPTENYPHYTITLISGSDVGYEAKVTANLDDDPALDEWRITQSNDPPKLEKDDAGEE